MTTSPRPAPRAHAPLRLALMVLILLLGAGLLFVNLLAESLWNDEAWTARATDPAHGLDHVLAQVREDVHPPLFFVELYGWRLLAGDHVLALRSFSVFLGLLSVAVVYALGRDLFSPAAGLLAALILAMHDLLRVYAQEVRHYPQLILLTALTLWTYWRFFQQPNRARMLAFVISGAALLWSHYWGIFVLGAAGLHTLTWWRRGYRAWLPAYAAIGLLFAPWLPWLIEQMTVGRPDGLPHALPNTRTVFDSLSFTMLGPPEALWAVLIAAGMAGALHGNTHINTHRDTRGASWRQQIARLRARLRPSAASGLLTLAFLLPLGLSLIMNEFYAVLSPRSLALLLPVMALLAGHTLGQFRPPERAVLIVAVLLLSLTTTGAIANPRAAYPHMASDLVQHSTPDQDVVLMELKAGRALDMDDVTLAYYLKLAGGGQIAWADSEGARLDNPAGFDAYLDAALTGADGEQVPGVWVARRGWPTDDLGAALTARGYIASAPSLSYGDFVGQPVTLERYDQPPNDGEAPLARYGGELALWRISHASYHAQPDDPHLETPPRWLTVNLLWRVAPQYGQPPSQNYTVSVFLLDSAGQLVTQHDSPPLDNRAPTLGWTPDGLYFDSHALPLDGVPPGAYSLGVKVYYRSPEGEIQDVPCQQPDGSPCPYAVLGTVTLAD